MPNNMHILMIRHAEKPDAVDDTSLSVKGHIRAHAYAGYFRNFATGDGHLTPDHLFSTRNSSRSHRPYLTLRPLAKELGLPINDQYNEEHYKKAAKEILEDPKYDSSNLLICWHHGEILQFAQALGASADSLPLKWPEDIYGWLLHLWFDSHGNLRVEPAINQQLMYDDHGKDPPPSDRQP